MLKAARFVSLTRTEVLSRIPRSPIWCFSIPFYLNRSPFSLPLLCTEFSRTLYSPIGVFQFRLTRTEVLSYFLYSAPNFQGLRSEHVHASDRAFLFRQHPCGRLSPASSHKAFTLHRAFQHSPLGSLLWWLFLHRRLRSRQRGSNLRLSDWAPSSWIHSKELLHVFIHATQVRLSTPPSQAFRLRFKAYQQFNSAILASKTACHHLCFLFLISVRCP